LVKEGAMEPIAKMIDDTIRARGLSRGALAREMGYTRTEKALRWLDALRQGYQVDGLFLRRLSAVLGYPDGLLQSQLDGLRAEEAAEARAMNLAKFRPHIRVIAAHSRPSQIFVVAITGTDMWLRAEIPQNVLDLPEAIRLDSIGALAHAHYAAKIGSAGPFGKIQGYYYMFELERGARLTIDGTVIGEDSNIPMFPSAVLELR
jgi:hypothetical protein